MPAQDTYDPQEMQRRLEAWLATRIEEARDVEVTNLAAPGESGFSSETMMFDASWTTGGARESAGFVLRTRPTGHVVFPVYDLAHQYDVMSKVSAATDVPLPPLRWMEPSSEPLGREFFVMERVEGVVPPDNLPYTMGGWLMESEPADQRRLQRSAYQTLARLHALDWRAAGLEVLHDPRHGRIGLDEQLGYYEYFLDWGRMGRPQPTIDRMAAWLRAHRPEPEPEPVLNWGDSRIGNLLFRDYTPVAVLDWEMATLGPREVDLAWMLLFERFFSSHLGVDNLPGFAPWEESIADYEAASGYRVGDLGWYHHCPANPNPVVMMRIVQAAELAGTDIGFTEADNVAVTLLEALEAEYC
jgi:aminoglycoside phosphotransferase (APT) family kinase protein